MASLQVFGRKALAAGFSRGVPRQHSAGFLVPRHYSTQPAQSPQRNSFAKTFGRPVFKVVLMAILTYQIAYLGWTKLEHDEIKAGKQAEIAELENQVKSLQSSGRT